MYERILVPVDWSADSDRAVAHAFAIATAFDAAVETLYVSETGPPYLRDRLDDEQLESVRRPSSAARTRTTSELSDRASDLGVEHRHASREGVPYREILEHARETDADAIVLGARGLGTSDRSGLGSTAERVLSLADLPVVAVPVLSGDDDVGTIAYDRVLVPLDGSDAAERAGKHALEFAEAVGADVYVLHVLDSTRYDLEEAPGDVVGLLEEGGREVVETIAISGRSRDLDVTTDVLRGIPDVEIAAYAEEVGANLIVMGVRGSALGPERLLGSTTGRVIGRSTCPVIVGGRDVADD